ncbi:unnamed protein product [Sphagnum jensenii]
MSSTRSWGVFGCCRNVFKTGVQLTAAADLESVWESRGGGEEHRNLMSDHRPSRGLRFFLGASNLEGLPEKGPSRAFEVLTGSSLKPGRPEHKLRLFLGPSFKPGRATGFKAQTALEALPAPLPQTRKGCRIEGLTVLEAFI